MGLSARSACPHRIAGLIKPSSSSCHPAFTVGMINTTGLRRFEQPSQPTDPWLWPGYVVPAVIVTTTRSASLDDSRRLPRVAGYTAGLCPTIWSGLSPRLSPLCVNAPSLRAIILRREEKSCPPTRPPQGFPQQSNASVPPPSRHLFLSGLTLRRCNVRLMLRLAGLLALLYRSDREFPSRRGRLRSSFPEVVSEDQPGSPVPPFPTSQTCLAHSVLRRDLTTQSG